MKLRRSVDLGPTGVTQRGFRSGYAAGPKLDASSEKRRAADLEPSSAPESCSDIPLIAHVVHRFDIGGMENGLVNLINRTPASRYRHAIICLTDYTSFKSRLAREVPLYAIHKREGKDLRHYARLWRALKRLRPDIVHTHNLPALESQFLAMLAGVRARIHGEHGRDVRDLDGASRRYRFIRACFRPVVTRFVPLSRDLARYLSEDVGVPESKIEVICNGVDTDRFRPASDARRTLREKLFGRGDHIVIGSVGRMESVKDPLTLVRAYRRLVEAMPESRSAMRLLMVGDGSLLRAVQDELEQADLAGMAVLPGASDDVPELLQAMDIFVLPSLAEGISNTILEAMASGLAVVATDVGGNAELVVVNETGLLVPRSDPERMARAMASYVDNAPLRRRHGARGRERVAENFSIDGMISKYLDVYDDVSREAAVGR